MIQYAAEIYILVSLDKNLNLVPSMPHNFCKYFGNFGHIVQGLTITVLGAKHYLT